VRLFLKAATALLALVLLGAAFFLVPPHLQVNGVEPPLPGAAQLRALAAAEDGPVAVRYVNVSTQPLPGGTLGHAVFLVEWANGNLFMIDAGMDRAAALEFASLLESLLGAGPAEFHGDVAELLGADVARVAGVGFTHLHIDHAQGVLPFCEARGPGATLYQTPWQAELHNFNTEQGAAIVAASCLQPGDLNGDGVMTIEGFPGLGIVGLGGHTPGSTLFAIPTGDRLWLLSGDTTNTRADLLSNTGKGFVYSYLLVPENTARTEALRLWLAGLDANDDMTVVVSHDLAEIEASGMAAHGR
jgi:glyoxylase-like metal-dependent hydrolase (beta-lactamase superfamily II)